ncbi:MAG: hypothetical protein MUO72_15420 [Bacteroidales bacterium]|nr:hypothetical protein [Bacteroidales bacterium]
MNNNKISQQFHALFGIFMVVFYLGVGIFVLFFANKVFIIEGEYKAILVIMGITFLLYGSYRIYATYKQIVEAFFSKGKDQE